MSNLCNSVAMNKTHFYFFIFKNGEENVYKLDKEKINLTKPLPLELEKGTVDLKTHTNWRQILNEELKNICILSQTTAKKDSMTFNNVIKVIESCVKDYPKLEKTKFLKDIRSSEKLSVYEYHLNESKRIEITIFKNGEEETVIFERSEKEYLCITDKEIMYETINDYIVKRIDDVEKEKFLYKVQLRNEKNEDSISFEMNEHKNEYELFTFVKEKYLKDLSQKGFTLDDIVEFEKNHA